MMERYERLANAVILLAARDYSKAYKRLQRCPRDTSAKDETNKLEGFFLSPFFSLFTNLDGEMLLFRIHREMEGGETCEVHTT